MGRPILNRLGRFLMALLCTAGVLSGGLAELGTVALSGVVTAILLLILLLAGIFVMARTTPQRVVEKVRESRAYDPYAEEEEELPPEEELPEELVDPLEEDRYWALT